LVANPVFISAEVEHALKIQQVDRFNFVCLESTTFLKDKQEYPYQNIVNMCSVLFDPNLAVSLAQTGPKYVMNFSIATKEEA